MIATRDLAPWIRAFVAVICQLRVLAYLVVMLLLGWWLFL